MQQGDFVEDPNETTTQGLIRLAEQRYQINTLSSAFLTRANINQPSNNNPNTNTTTLPIESVLTNTTVQPTIINEQPNITNTYGTETTRDIPI